MSTNQALSDTGAFPIIETILCDVPTGVVARPPAVSDERTKGWKASEERIAAWAPTSGEPDVRKDEDGYLLPSNQSVAVALEIATRLREAGAAVPLRLTTTANGGVSFEWRSGNRTERLIVNARGETELMMFENAKLISRKALSLRPAER